MTYAGVPTFMIEPTDRVQVGLRRYVRHGTGWTCAEGYHRALVILGETAAIPSGHGGVWGDGDKYVDYPWPARDDPAWPSKCESCSYEFTTDDEWQKWIDLLWRRLDGTGDPTPLRDIPPGAMWDAYWYPWKGPDGRCLVVRCPNGQDWVIDSRASNCTMPTDTIHRCWVRHGEPPNITVDKNGNTCAAGAGSILAGDYHGFLRDGRFTAG